MSGNLKGRLLACAALATGIAATPAFAQDQQASTQGQELSNQTSVSQVRQARQEFQQALQQLREATEQGDDQRIQQAQQTAREALRTVQAAVQRDQTEQRLQQIQEQFRQAVRQGDAEMVQQVQGQFQQVLQDALRRERDQQPATDEQLAQAGTDYPEGTEYYLATVIGQVASINRDDRTLTLQDGATFQLGQNVALDRLALRPGQPVMINFNSEGDRLVATRIFDVSATDVAASVSARGGEGWVPQPQAIPSIGEMSEIPSPSWRVPPFGPEGLQAANEGQEDAQRRLQQAYEQLMAAAERGDRQAMLGAQQAGQLALSDLQRFQDIQRAEQAFRQEQAGQLPSGFDRPRQVEQYAQQLQRQGLDPSTAAAVANQLARQDQLATRRFDIAPGPAEGMGMQAMGRGGMMQDLSPEARRAIEQAHVSTARAFQHIQSALQRLQQEGAQAQQQLGLVEEPDAVIRLQPVPGGFAIIQ